MLSVAVAESRPQDLQVAVRDFVVRLKYQIVPRRSPAAWTLVLSITCLAAVLSPHGPEDSGFSPAGVFYNADQRRVFDALTDLLAVARHEGADQRIDDVWCNHIVTVDSQGFTDKVLDCRTMAAWRAATRRTPTGDELMAQAR